MAVHGKKTGPCRGRGRKRAPILPFTAPKPPMPPIQRVQIEGRCSCSNVEPGAGDSHVDAGAGRGATNVNSYPHWMRFGDQVAFLMGRLRLERIS